MAILGLRLLNDWVGGGLTGYEAPLDTSQKPTTSPAELSGAPLNFLFSFHVPRKSAPKKSKADGQ